MKRLKDSLAGRMTLHVGLLAFALIASTLGSRTVAAQPGSPDAGLQAPKWFVLRDHQSGNCRAALLVPVQGHYVNRSGLKASGPYNTKVQALAHKEVLEQRGTCEKG